MAQYSRVVRQVKTVHRFDLSDQHSEVDDTCGEKPLVVKNLIVRQPIHLLI
ncbi:hypothetical protein H6F88_17485 [Oculatella sp. FACHB-28]|uniref:hypothetical protein n=1 Tax=Oculatella sp. FACHB-28 TaxID=2692845 RepID=UPI0016852D50|nr:hypothetical protein [Oculatella sp. FACHB-28]MBD2057790.1 hypothetical protein [Oculatella sp. FACHB-28]